MSSTVQQTTFPTALLNKPPISPNYVLFNDKKPKNIRIASLNTQGKYFDQIPRIYDIIKEQKIDILCIQDTGIQSKRKRDDFYNLRNYETTTITPDLNNSEGMKIIFNKSIASKEPTTIIHKEARTIQLKIDIANTEYIISNVYIVPQKNAKRTEQLIELEKIIEPSKNNIIIGDLNAYECDSLDRWSNVHKKSKLGTQKIFELFKKLNLQDTFRLINGNKRKYTRFGFELPKNKMLKTRIDQCWISDEISNQVENADIIQDEIVLSDHRIIFTDMKVDIANEELFETFKRPDMDKLDKDKLNKSIQEAYASTEHNYRNLVNILKANNPESKEFSLNKPFVCDKRIRQLKKNYKIIKNSLKTLLIEERIINREDIQLILKEYELLPSIDHKETLENILKRTRNKIIYRMREMQDEKGLSISKLIEDNIKANPEFVYKLIKGKRTKNAIESVMLNGKVHTEKVEVLEIVKNEWQKQFEDTTQRPTKPNYPKRTSKNIQGDRLMAPISKDEIETGIQSLRNRSAAGPDEIYNEMLKCLEANGIEWITEIVNNCLAQKDIPEEWKHSRLYPIYKNSGSRLEMKNFRPIALISTIYKLFSSIINKRMQDYIQLNNLIPLEQSGFQAGKDTHTNIKVLIDVIEDSNQHKKEFHAIFIDLSKAYDSVTNWNLKDTLNELNFPDNFNTMIENMYKNNTADVITAYGATEKFKIGKGLRQGDPLSPTLFNLILTNTLETIKRLKTGYILNNVLINNLAYADDIVLIDSSENGINKQLNSFQEFMNYYNIQINASKTAYMWNNTKKTPTMPKIRNSEIEALGKSLSYKYLGIQINASLNWNDQIIAMTNRYKVRVHQIVNKKFINPQLKVKLVNCMAIPVITYSMANIIYDGKTLDEIKKWTIRSLNKSINCYSNINSQCASVLYGLEDLQAINKAKYISFNVNRVLNGTNIANSVIDHTKLIDKLNDMEETTKINVVDTINKRKVDPVQPGNKRERRNEGIKLEDRKLVWTDGSYTNNMTVSASWWYEGSKKNRTYATEGQSSYEAECIAIELAINECEYNDKIRIITDSQAAIQGILGWQKKKDSLKRKSKYFSLLNRIWLKIKSKNVNIMFSHVYGHLTENIKSDKAEWIEKWQKTRTKWNENTELIVNGNKIVDQMTQKATLETKREWNPIGSGRYVIVKMDTEKGFEGNLYKEIKDKLTKINNDKWINRTKAKFMSKIRDSRVDWKSSTWPVNVKTDYRAWANFKHKLLTGLPTRHAVYNPNKTNKKQYSTDKCPHCAQTETTEHIFSCDTATKIRDKIFKKCIENINNITKFDWCNFPAWFTTTFPKPSNPLKEVKTLMEFDKTLGNYGIIPKALNEFAINIVEDKEDAEQIMNELRIFINKSIYAIWRERCKAIFKNIPKETQPTTTTQNTDNPSDLPTAPTIQRTAEHSTTTQEQNNLDTASTNNSSTVRIYHSATISTSTTTL